MADRVLWPDTNVTRKTRRFMELLGAAERKGVAVVIHAQVFLETRRHRQCERAAKGLVFDAGLFDGLFSPSNNVSARFHDLVVDLDRARRWSELLVQRHPTDDVWQDVKRRALRAAVGVASENRNIPMTADWWIALSAEEMPDAWVVTEDGGPEWEPLREALRVMSLESAMVWLGELPDRVG